MQLDDKQIWGASNALSKTTRNTKGYVRDVRKCLTLVIDPDSKPGDRHPFHGWTYTVGNQERTVTYETFEQYLKKWCQFTLDELRDLFCRDIEITNLLDIACQQKDGNPSGNNQHGTFDDIQGSSAPTGTSKEAGLRRLRRDRPDLHQQVLDGEKSVNAAMVEAGFRKPSITLQLTEPALAAQKIRDKFGEEFAFALGTLLVSPQ